MTTYKNKSDMILSDDDDSYDMITTYKNKSDMLVLSRYLIALASQSHSSMPFPLVSFYAGGLQFLAKEACSFYEKTYSAGFPHTQPACF